MLGIPSSGEEVNLTPVPETICPLLISRVWLQYNIIKRNRKRGSQSKLGERIGVGYARSGCVGHGREARRLHQASVRGALCRPSGRREEGSWSDLQGVEHRLPDRLRGYSVPRVEGSSVGQDQGEARGSQGSSGWLGPEHRGLTLKGLLTLSELLDRSGRKPPYGRFLAIDPGLTTGIAFFDGTQVIRIEQVGGCELPEGQQKILSLISHSKPERIVIEKFILYPWRLKNLSYNEMITPQIIGVVKMQAFKMDTPISEQTAAQGKAFFTDKRLRQLSLYYPGKKHANDAIRHGCYYLLFGERSQ